MWIADGLLNAISNWLNRDVRPIGTSLSDFGEMRNHLRPADVILVEGRTRIAGVIQAVTLSSWTHSALYVGRPSEMLDPDLGDWLCEQLGYARDTQLVLEAEIGEGVIISPLSRYAEEHLRLCRPTGLTHEDAQAVIGFGVERLGEAYDVRQIFDLLRFFFPYGLLPRHWRSTLFETGSGQIAHTICSTLLAQAFNSVHYPILPRVSPGGHGEPVFHQVNSRLMTPRDFDYSPYFDIVKYPFYGEAVENYRDLHWEAGTDGDSGQSPAPSRSLGA